jgi:hypothetical protein
VSLSGLMEEFMKENTMMIRRKALESLVGLMVKNMLECGRQVNNMEKVPSLIKKDKLGVVSGKEAKEYVGIMKFINEVKRRNKEIVIVIII